MADIIPQVIIKAKCENDGFEIFSTHLRLFSSDACFYVRLRKYAQYASMNEFTCSEHSVRIRRSKKRRTGNQPLVKEKRRLDGKYVAKVVRVPVDCVSLEHAFHERRTYILTCSGKKPNIFLISILREFHELFYFI